MDRRVSPLIMLSLKTNRCRTMPNLSVVPSSVAMAEVRRKLIYEPVSEYSPPLSITQAQLASSSTETTVALTFCSITCNLPDHVHLRRNVCLPTFRQHNA